MGLVFRGDGWQPVVRMGRYQGIALAVPTLLEIRRLFSGWVSKTHFHHRLLQIRSRSQKIKSPEFLPGSFRFVPSPRYAPNFFYSASG